MKDEVTLAGMLTHNLKAMFLSLNILPSLSLNIYLSVIYLWQPDTMDLWFYFVIFAVVSRLMCFSVLVLHHISKHLIPVSTSYLT